MKQFSKFLLAAFVTSTFFAACNKIDPADPLPQYALGVSPVLSSSVTTIAPLVTDSNKAVITFTWTNPKYSNDSSTTKYILQIDSAGRNFSKAISTTIIGSLSKTFLAKEINAMVLSLGFSYNVQYNVDARVISSYNNNNEQY